MTRFGDDDPMPGCCRRADLRRLTHGPCGVRCGLIEGRRSSRTAVLSAPAVRRGQAHPRIVEVSPNNGECSVGTR
ncbi:hypothetical protein NKG05_30440 [Oerskovia sp. M15]